MVDQFDLAQEMDARYRQQALDKQAKKSEVTASLTVDCIDCGEEIPKGRRLAVPWCERCVNCQQTWERTNG